MGSMMIINRIEGGWNQFSIHHAFFRHDSVI